MTTGEGGRENIEMLGIDVGGTKIAAGVVCFPEGKVLQRTVAPTPAKSGGEAVLKEVERLAEELSAGRRLDGIGIGLCELVDPQGEVVSGNCVTWRSEEVRRALARFGVVVIEADVRAAAMAEARFGAGRGRRVFLYVTIGTGISSALVIAGKAFTGARGATGTMASGPMPALSGRSPTVEEISSGPALVKRYAEAGCSAKTGQEVIAAAEQGEAVGRGIVETAAEVLGGTIGWLVNVLDPEAIVLGGGLGLTEGIYRQRLVAAARKHIWWDGHRDVPILSAKLGADAGVIGAAQAAWELGKVD